jgi:uncharacterized membrane protein
MPRLFANTPYGPRQARGRLATAVVVATLVSLALARAAWALRIVAAWDALALTLLATTWWVIGRSDATETRRRARGDDPGRTAIWFFVLVSSTISVFAGVYLLRKADALAPRQGRLLAVLCLIAVVSAWALTHTSYALHYAHLYYRDEDSHGGLEFPGGELPDNFDFAYYSFTLGMCFQVSDVTVSGRAIRRATLLHAILAFAYNTAILALVLDLLFGLVD